MPANSQFHSALYFLGCSLDRVELNVNDSTRRFSFHPPRNMEFPPLMSESLFGLSMIYMYVLQCLTLKREQEEEEANGNPPISHPYQCPNPNANRNPPPFSHQDARRFPPIAENAVLSVRPLVHDDCPMAIDIWLSGISPPLPLHRSLHLNLTRTLTPTLMYHLP